VPVIASGGMGSIDDFLQAAQQGRADGVSMADVLHYNRLQISDIRAAALKAGLAVRQIQ
jgi:imidazole glycerol-phosphate synthase subunit HisF